MDEANQTGVLETAAGMTDVARLRNRLANVRTVPQHKESIEPRGSADVKWTAIYRLFGASTEAMQDEVFAAVNLYFLGNGTSVFGKYKRSIRTAGGVEVVAADIVKIIGQQSGLIRQFMRAKMLESYTFLKHNRAVQEDEVVLQQASEYNLERSQAWLLADWLEGCPHFVGDEDKLYSAIRARRIGRANKQRLIQGVDPDEMVVDEDPARYEQPVVDSPRLQYGRALY